MLAFLTSRLAGPIFGASTAVLILALSTLWTVDYFRIGSRDRQIAALHGEINNPMTGWRARWSTCRINGIAQEESISRQNAAVVEMRRTADVITEAARAAVAAVRDEGRRAATTAAGILARAVPVAEGEQCRAALELVRERSQ